MSLDELEEKQIEENIEEANIEETNLKEANIEVKNNNAAEDNEQPVKLTKSIITAIVVPLLLIALSVFIYVMDQTSLVGLIIAIVLFIAFGVIIYIGGFYFFIIPLPFISIVPNGCLRNLSMRKKVILVLLCVLSVVLAFGAMYIF